jgi:hypothetical protein
MITPAGTLAEDEAELDNEDKALEIHSAPPAPIAPAPVEPTYSVVRKKSDKQKPQNANEVAFVLSLPLACYSPQSRFSEDFPDSSPWEKGEEKGPVINNPLFNIMLQQPPSLPPRLARHDSQVRDVICVTFISLSARTHLLLSVHLFCYNCSLSPPAP